MKAFRKIKGRVLDRFLSSATLVGLASLVWLLIRSGRKPSRLSYPCQRAAAVNSGMLLGGLAGIAAPIAARLPVVIRPGSATARKRLATAMKAAGVVAMAGLLAYTLIASRDPGPVRSMDEMKAAAAALSLQELRSGRAGASDIFVAENIPAKSEHGVDYLIQVMAGNGLDFFKSSAGGHASGPEGLIAKDDIVLIKVNGEWRYRGGTNTDVVKGLVNAIVHHPDGFTGEVAIVENGQWDSYMDNRPDNQNPSSCNAEDRGQSFNDVALMFAAQGHRVSVYDWTAVQTSDVGEFQSGDMRDGYVYVPEIEEGYPKFTTNYGTRVSLRYGQWTGSGYDNARVKMLNVPVLKDHGGPGVTCAVKHWMGVQDLWKRTQSAPHGPMVSEGILGKVMLKSHFPELNIADCIWVTPAGGPNGPYEKAVRLDRLVASQDPIALDYYCGKYVLMPVSGDGRHNPAYGQFHQMLSTTRDVLVAGGKQVTMDESNMNVYRVWAPDVPPATRYEYFLAEGCTAYGFETWVLVANPNDEPATILVSYLTDSGPINKDPVTVPGRSRLTLNVASDAWAMNTGVRVGSDRPVYVERAMYWGERAEGHDSIAAAAGAKDWYVADGHTADGFESWIEILNTKAEETTAHVTYMTPSGTVPGPRVTVPGYSRRTLSMADTVNGSDVSARVTSDGPVVVERSMYWNARRGGCGSNAVAAPAKDWYLAEGATHSGFETYILLMNPGASEARASLETMTSKGKAAAAVSVPAGARRTVKLNDMVHGEDVSTRVTSDVPVVAERTMLWPTGGGRAGHSTVGMTAPSSEIFLPEGCTAYGFETWLLLQNPGDKDAVVAVYAMTDGGEKGVGTFDVKAGRRVTVRLNDYYTGDLSTRIASSVPVVCERAMYWNGRGGGTGSIGYPAD